MMTEHDLHRMGVSSKAQFTSAWILAACLILAGIVGGCAIAEAWGA